MLIPAPALLVAVGGLLVLSIAASFAPTLDRALAAATALVVLAASADAWRLRRRPPPALRRQVPHALALGAETEVGLLLENSGSRPTRLQLFDHVPAGFEFSGLPLAVPLAAGQSARLGYRLRAQQRGGHRFDRCELRMASPWRLWWRRLRAGEATEVKVYPNFAALARFALLATDHRLSQLGLLQRRRRGEGLDFHQLREYREGDAPRQIDWKASARMRKVISREYREERDQQIVIVLDCGRRMAAKDGPLSHLDHAMNAALLLSFVALRQGDAVGLLTLGGEERWLPPRKSRIALDGLLQGCYDLRDTLDSPDYRAAATALLRRQRRRALVVLLSNLRDEDDDDLRDALALLRRQHRVVLASLREPIIEDALHAPVDGLDAALTHAASADYLSRRRRSFARLEKAAICLDVEPADLPLALVDRYLELKREGRM